MKVEVKKMDGSKREIAVEVTGDIVKDKFRQVFESIGKEAKVPGFRPGHVPADILEKNFASLAHERVAKELISELYNKALEQENIDAIELPNITDVKLDRANLSFKATVEISPEIKIKNYKGIKVGYKKIEAPADEVKRRVDSLKESRKIDSIDDNFARSLGYPSPAELEKAIERQIMLEKDNEQRRSIENGIIDTLINETSFNAPRSMVEHQLEDLVRQAKIDLAIRGVPREKVDEQEKTLSVQLAAQAEKQVKAYLILAEIAKKENIPLDNQMSGRVMELILREADWDQV